MSRRELPGTGPVQVFRDANGRRRFVRANGSGAAVRSVPQTAADRRRRLAALEAGLDADRRARLERLARETKTAAAQRSGSASHFGVETYRRPGVAAPQIVSVRVGDAPNTWR